MADEFLTQELPAIRRAQERSLAALDSVVRLISWGLWRGWSPSSQVVMRDEAEVADLERFNEATPSFAPAFTDESSKPQSLPLSTAAMCLDAVEAVAEARGIQGLPKAGDVRNKAVKLRDRMLKELREVCSRLEATESPAFGKDDVLTASWLLPIIYKPAKRRSKEAQTQGRAADASIGLVKPLGLVKAAIYRLVLPEQHMIPGNDERKNTAEDHPWPASLAVRAVNLVSRGSPSTVLGRSRADEVREWSERQVRLQLALSVTGEAGQDAAHLAAALAVAMWLEEVPLPLLEAAVDALGRMQRPDGSFPLSRPFLADMQGSANTPMAADLTLAMIAVADQLHVRYPEHPTVFRLEQKLLGAVQQQREWFFRAATRGGWKAANGEDGMVWWSEHAKSSPGTCHTWATARTATALAMILNLESRLITRRLLEESRFSYRPARSIEKGFEGLVDPQKRADARVVGRRVRQKGPLVAAIEGVLASPNGKDRSVLLFGPPGTSKTTLIEAVAKQLEHSLVQLSPADFLLDGPNRVEHRAKRIFDYLTQMEDVVVIFDEIDRLILDRGTKAYAKQQDVFQFMTPSMLPKLKALRDRRVVRFAIATNYGERIDPAIARRGRIDAAFIVPPPNRRARTRILKKEGIEPAAKLAAATPLWVYGDLSNLQERDPRKAKDLRPSVDLQSYSARVADTTQKDRLAEEILQLGELCLETPDVLRHRGKKEMQAISWALLQVGEERRSQFGERLSQAGFTKLEPPGDFGKTTTVEIAKDAGG